MSKTKKRVFTTGEVARLLGMNINTVIKWFDEGDLEGFRLPRSNERRIPVTALRKFMTKHGIPADLLGESEQARRAAARVECNMPAQITIRNGRSVGPLPALVTDLSTGGARLKLDSQNNFAVPVGRFELVLDIQDSALAGTEFPGKLVHLFSRDSGVSIGMQFEPLPAEPMRILQSFLDRQDGDWR